MMKVSFNREKERNLISLKIKGHAGQDEYGKDIVCASASILAYTVAQYLHYIHEKGGLDKEPLIILEEGNALIVAKPTEEYEGEVLNAFFVAEVGYSLLQQTYPQYVELNMFGEPSEA